MTCLAFISVDADRVVSTVNEPASVWEPVRIEGQVSDEGTRREKAREVIQGKKLPNRPPDRMWGGPGAGADCAICSAPVTRAELEFEIEFARAGDDPGVDTYHVHIHCFAPWQVECNKLDRLVPGGVSSDQPDG
jgi:hypothetical protein